MTRLLAFCSLARPLNSIYQLAIVDSTPLLRANLNGTKAKFNSCAKNNVEPSERDNNCIWRSIG